jgi:hypothetical protein
MPFETPRTHAHCLQILKTGMRTDLLMFVLEGMLVRIARKDKESPIRRLMASLTALLWMCRREIDRDVRGFIGALQPNPFNVPPGGRFDPEQALRHDLKLLQHQLRALAAILAEQGDSSAFLPGAALLSAEQVWFAECIDEHARSVFAQADGQTKLRQSLPACADDYQRLTDISNKKQLDELSRRYDGFRRVRECLEDARSSANGQIPNEL